MPGTQNKLIVRGNIEIFCPIRQTTDHAKNPATIFWCLKFRILIYLTTPILLYSCIKKIRRGATFGNFEKLNRQIINSEQLQKKWGLSCYNDHKHWDGSILLAQIGTQFQAETFSLIAVLGLLKRLKSFLRLTVCTCHKVFSSFQSVAVWLGQSVVFHTMEKIRYGSYTLCNWWLYFSTNALHVRWKEPSLDETVERDLPDRYQT